MRPLTETLPKPLLPVMNVPMVDLVVDLLPKEVDRLVIAVSYKAADVRRHFEERGAGRKGLDVVVVDEGDPLGTGGAVKNVGKHLDGTFLVVNGDVICSIDLEAMLAHHRARKGVGTISVWRVEDPSPYGVIETAPGTDRITAFTEKPKKEEARSDLINAGTYILEPEALDLIAPGKFVSMETEVFPVAIGRPGGMFIFGFEGFWFDAGKPPDYLAIHRTLIDVKGAKAGIPGFKEPGLAGKGCWLEKGASVGPYVSLGAKVKVAKGAVVTGSVVFDSVTIGEGAVIKDSIIGKGSRIGKGAKVTGAVVGYDTVVKDGAELRPGDKAWDGYNKG